MLGAVVGIAAVLVGASPEPGAQAPAPGPSAQDAPAPGRAAVVLSLPASPYREVAEEIAGAEGLPLVASLAAAPPTPATLHVLWIAAPGELSDAVMVQAGLFLRDHPRLAVGIITGSTPELARALWLRGPWARGERAASAVAKQTGGGEGVPVGLVADGPDGRSRGPLTTEAFANALTATDYVSFAGHGTSVSLALPGEARFRADSIPLLGPVVVATGACNTLRPWAPGSLALAFVDRGAAAYAGFVYSPISGYLLGQFRDLPHRHSWPGFSMGDVIRLQNQGTRKGFAAFPYYLLLGDPRIHLRGDAPYRVLRDETSDGERVVELELASGGVIPVRVPGGEGYGFVRVPGVGSLWEGDRFYNSRLQMADDGEDKLLLVVVEGEGEPGTLTLILRERPSWHRAFTRPLTDALDHTFVFLPQTGSVPAPTFGILTLFLVLLWERRRRKGGEGGAVGGPRSGRPLLRAFLAGAALALLFALYGTVRADHVVITTKVVTPSLMDALDLFLLVSGAALLFLLSRSWKGKTLAVLIGTGPALGPALFTPALFAAVNLQISSRIGTGIYSHPMGVLSGISFLLVLPLVLGTFTLAARNGRPGKDPRPTGI